MFTTDFILAFEESLMVYDKKEYYCYCSLQRQIYILLKILFIVYILLEIFKTFFLNTVRFLFDIFYEYKNSPLNSNLYQCILHSAYIVSFGVGNIFNTVRVYILHVYLFILRTIYLHQADSIVQQYRLQFGCAP